MLPCCQLKSFHFQHSRNILHHCLYNHYYKYNRIRLFQCMSPLHHRSALYTSFHFSMRHLCTCEAPGHCNPCHYSRKRHNPFRCYYMNSCSNNCFCCPRHHRYRFAFVLLCRCLYIWSHRLYIHWSHSCSPQHADHLGKTDMIRRCKSYPMHRLTHHSMRHQSMSAAFGNCIALRDRKSVV